MKIVIVLYPEKSQEVILEVPLGVNINKSDVVLFHSKEYGTVQGVTLTNSIECDDAFIQYIVHKLENQRLPLDRIIGKYRLERFEENDTDC